MKKWTAIVAAVFLFAACHTKNQFPEKKAAIAGSKDFDKKMPEDSFTVTLSRGSGDAVYARNGSGETWDSDQRGSKGCAMNTTL